MMSGASSSTQAHAQAQSKRKNADEAGDSPSKKSVKIQAGNAGIVSARVFKDPKDPKDFTEEEKAQEKRFQQSLVNIANPQHRKAMWSPVTGYCWIYTRKGDWVESCIRHPGAGLCPVCTRSPTKTELYCQEVANRSA